MMPASNQGMGMNFGMPDVCLTPMGPAPVPIPYPNIGMNATNMPFSPNILVSFLPALNMASKPLLTNGDNAGVAHPLFMQTGGTTMGNPKILMSGMPAAHLLVPTYGNNFNAPLGAKVVPSVTNVLLCATLGPAQGQSAARRLHQEAGSLRLLTDNILIIRLPCIALRTDRWLRTQLRKWMGKALRGIALDLRGNPGGSLVVAHRLAKLLAGMGAPIAIASDHRTASAAEVLAALLQDHIGAVTVGQQTYGKGRAESFWCSPEQIISSGHKATIQRPNGQPIDGIGIAPSLPSRPENAIALATHWLRDQSSKAS